MLLKALSAEVLSILKSCLSVPLQGRPNQNRFFCLFVQLMLSFFVWLMLLLMLWEIKAEDVSAVSDSITSQCLTVGLSSHVTICGQPYGCHSEIKACLADGNPVLASFQLWQCKQSACAVPWICCFRVLM